VKYLLSKKMNLFLYTDFLFKKTLETFLSMMKTGEWFKIFCKP